MFMCKKCHEKDIDCNFPHRGLSNGPCELCGEVSLCVECQAPFKKQGDPSLLKAFKDIEKLK